MGRRKKSNGKRSGGQPPRGGSGQAKVSGAPSSRPDAGKARDDAMSGLDEDARQRVTSATPRPPSQPDIAREWRLLREAQAAYEERRREVDGRARALDERETRVANRERALASDREKAEAREEATRAELAEARATLKSDQRALNDRGLDLEGREATLNERERGLDRREAELNARQSQIIEREQAADAGFIERDKASLAQLEQRLESLRGEADATRARIADAHAEFDRERSQRRESLEAEVAEGRQRALSTLADELSARRAEVEAEVERRRAEVDQERANARGELDVERAALRERDARLHRDQTTLELEQTLLAEDRAALSAEIARRCAAQIQTLEDRVRAEQQRREAVEADRDRLFAELESGRALDREFGPRGEVHDELTRLRERVAELQEALDARPGRADEARLVKLEEELRAARGEIGDLRAAKAAAEAQASRNRVGAAELEQLVREKEVLEVHRDALKVAIDALRQDVGELRERGGAANPFTECGAMDEELGLMSPIALQTRPLNLKDFAERVRHRIAIDPDDPRKRLRYTARDIRSFIGGLSMSRLHLLQGISGTGKTSLPRAFARAIGGRTLADAAIDLVEVQAGWRDQLDLLGHYNAFQRRFYEGEFLKALYRASTPAFAGRPFFIVLDEMNLSRPEQYFATLLSALERPKDALITLMEHGPAAHPKRFKAGGRKIALPPNVWFIGTANHDETTVEFADKTYDRAHVMELPRQREGFEVDKQLGAPPTEPLALEALQGAFDEAIDRHGARSLKAMQTLAEQIGPALDDRFRVGWGNRLEDQVQRYAPVIIAAGGSMGEAIDHVLATKILRKVRDRYDTSVDDIKALSDAIVGAWGHIDTKHAPERSLSILDDEERRKKVGQGR